MAKQLVLFDFDGTLVNSQPGFDASLQEFSEMRNLSCNPRMMSKGYVDPLKNDLGWGVSLEQQPVLLKELNDYYSTQMMHEKRFLPEFYPHVQWALEKLSNDYTLGIVTARYRETLELILDAYDMKDMFPHRRTWTCAREGQYEIKPDPYAVHCIVKNTGHALSDVVVIGDTTADIGMANNAKTKSIAVLWGSHSEEILATAQPTVLIDSARHMPKAVAAALGM